MGLFYLSLFTMPDKRVTYRRRHCYNTKSNKTRVVKTPGGKLTIHYREKLGSGVKRGDCGIVLPGIPHLRPKQYARLPKSQKTVSRAYGGSRCGNCVRERILRAFLVEEQREAKASAIEAAREEAKQKAQQTKGKQGKKGKK